ncbi:MAG: CBS domain-containing protein [Salinivenus sp.]
MKDIIQSKDILTGDGDDVLTTPPFATVYECIDRMVASDVGSIVVMDEDAIVGIFTERDYMRNIVLEGRTSKTTEVREVMQSDVATVHPDKPLAACLHLMTELRCRHLPVVDDQEELIGIVSIGDGVKEIVGRAQQETTRLRRYVTGVYPV